jgi:hypothetical protein
MTDSNTVSNPNGNQQAVDQSTNGKRRKLAMSLILNVV